jgi:hypothetical protein
MTTAWAHLPNAKHIDRILADEAEHPERWSAVGYAFLTPDWVVARHAAVAAARTAAKDAGREDALSRTYDVLNSCIRVDPWIPIWGAALALISWDHAGDLLDLPPDELEAIAKLGVPAAIMLLAACRALNHSLKEMQ